MRDLSRPENEPKTDRGNKLLPVQPPEQVPEGLAVRQIKAVRASSCGGGPSGLGPASLCVSSQEVVPEPFRSVNSDNRGEDPGYTRTNRESSAKFRKQSSLRLHHLSTESPQDQLSGAARRAARMEVRYETLSAQCDRSSRGGRLGSATVGQRAAGPRDQAARRKKAFGTTGRNALLEN